MWARRLLAALSLGFFLGQPGLAEAREVWSRSSGQWTVKLFHAPGETAWCSWDTVFHSSRRTVSFMLNSAGLHLFVSGANMRLDRLRGERAAVSIGSRRYPVTFTFSEYREASRIGATAGLIAAGDAEMRDFIVNFAQANEATLHFANGATWSIGLRGTAASLDRMVQCTAEMRQRNGQGLNLDPSARRPPPVDALDPTDRVAPRGMLKQ